MSEPLNTTAVRSIIKRFATPAGFEVLHLQTLVCGDDLDALARVLKL